MPFDRAIFGDPVQDGYGFTEMGAFNRTQVFRGTSRYRLSDTQSPMVVNVTWVWGSETFVVFRDLWSDELRSGAEWFKAWLMLGSYADGQVMREYDVHSLDGYSALPHTFGTWAVSMRLEVRQIGQVTGPWPDCDHIYGGPLDDLSPDVIYGGPLDDLSPDVIAPCNSVNPRV